MTPRRPWSPQSRHELHEVLSGPTSERAVSLAASRNAAVRCALAAAETTPVGVLIYLSRDQHPAVRAAVAANPAVVVSVSTMRVLASDEHLEVRAALAGNASAPHVVVNRRALSFAA